MARKKRAGKNSFEKAKFVRCWREKNRIICMVKTNIKLTRKNISNEFVDFSDGGAYDILTYAACDELEKTLGMNQESYWFMSASFDYKHPLRAGLKPRNVEVLIPLDVWFKAWGDIPYELTPLQSVMLRELGI